MYIKYKHYKEDKKSLDLHVSPVSSTDFIKYRKKKEVSNYYVMYEN
jgi:hypothetical protein